VQGQRDGSEALRCSAADCFLDEALGSRLRGGRTGEVLGWEQEVDVGDLVHDAVGFIGRGTGPGEAFDQRRSVSLLEKLINATLLGTLAQSARPLLLVEWID
jgi:hypothetical protein